MAKRYSGSPYRRAIRAYVRKLENLGIHPILDLHWAAPGNHRADHLLPMADADNTPDFWRSVAEAYRDDAHVLFDLYNEPYDVNWRCWLRGCTLRDHRFGTYRTAGMAELVRVVRSTGAEQPLLVGGLAYARNLNGWAAHLPKDPAHALVASIHTYDFAACFRRCRAGLSRIARHHPVITGELGEADCDHDYIDPYMRWADRHHVSYLGWAWNATDRYWTCRGGPSLIEDWTGTPTPFGVGLRDHLARIARRG